MSEPLLHQIIHRKLSAALAPTLLEITDDSAKHAGHAGHDPRGESHFRIRIVSENFAGLDRVARHRLVYEILSVELKSRIHALAMRTYTLNEYNQWLHKNT